MGISAIAVNKAQAAWSEGPWGGVIGLSGSHFIWLPKTECHCFARPLPASLSLTLRGMSQLALRSWLKGRGREKLGSLADDIIMGATWRNCVGSGSGVGGFKPESPGWPSGHRFLIVSRQLFYGSAL